MAISSEPSFPRGGKKPPQLNALDKKSRPSFKLFGAKPKNKTKTKQGYSIAPRERFTLTGSQPISAVSADLLTYKTIQEGMVVLGCVKQIQKLGLTVSLPGRLTSYVPITNISSPYTKLLKGIVEDNNAPEDFSGIAKLFTVGEYVRCKIMEVVHSDSNDLHKVTVSLSPKDIQADWIHAQLEKGVIVTAAVSSKEDHGYVMDVGIDNARAFLPKENVDKDLSVGQVIWCLVQKATKIDTANTVVLNAKPEIIFQKSYKTGELQSLLPGMKVEFTITKILNDGYEGSFLNDFTGYINESQLAKPLDQKTHEVDDVLQAYVLYITPTTKLTYLTLRNIETPANSTLAEGFISNAKVLSRVNKGLYVKLSKTEKGFISYRRLKKNIKPSENIETALNAYQAGSTHRCRVLDYDLMENVYICTLEKDLVNEKYFSGNDLNLGDFVQVVIEKITPRGVEVKLGRLDGFVPNFHLSDISLHFAIVAKKFQIGQRVNARVLSKDDDSKSIRLTFKQTLVDSKLPPLTSYDEFDKNQEYQGFVVRLIKSGILVAFYGDVRGFLPVKNLNLEKGVDILQTFKIGEFIKCRVLSSNPEAKRMTLTLKRATKGKKVSTLSVGKIVAGTVTHKNDDGLKLRVRKLEGAAILPTLHLSEHPKLCPLLLEQYNVGDILQNLVCVGTSAQNAYVSLRANITKCTTFEEVEKDTTLRCSFKSYNDKGATLFAPIKDYRKYIFVSKRNVVDVPIEELKDLKLKKYQTVLAKVITVDRSVDNRLILASTKISDCGGVDKNFAAKYLASYLNGISGISDIWRDEGKKIAEINIGDLVSGKVVKINDDGHYEATLNGDISMIIPKVHSKKPLKVGDNVKGVVLWADLLTKKVYISTNPTHVEQMAEKRGLELKGKVTGEILLVNEDFLLTLVVSKDQFAPVFLPTKLHLNHFLIDLSEYKIGQSITISIDQPVNDNQWYIGTTKNMKIIGSEPKIVVKSESETSPQTKKRKVSETDESVETDIIIPNLSKKQEIKVEHVVENVSKKKKRKNVIEDIVEIEPLVETPVKNKKRKVEAEEVKPKKSKNKENNESEQNIVSTVVLPGVDSFWNLTPDALRGQEDSSDDDDPEEEKPKKKKKLSKAEKFEEAKQKETEIRKKELILADENAIPKTAEQFDRLVIAQPDNSHAWISYIAFHLQTTEIEKARAIAQKAISTISFREEQEKLNVWVALLNLENRYGTKQSFTSVLTEAARMNDSRIVYMRALQILADSGKTADFTELLNTVLRKYKHESSTWYESAAACFQLGMDEKARSIFQRALTALDSKQHIDFITRFAYLEVKHGNIDRAETLFEQILASYPRRIDIWSAYVDMLVKADKVDIARKVLERSISLKLPARKMKTLFKKFIDFEKQHGDEASVEKVKLFAVQYVESATT